MNWTKELPTRPGFYWFRDARCGTQVISVRDIGNGLEYTSTGGNPVYDPGPIAELAGGEFAGPIAPPAEPE